MKRRALLYFLVAAYAVAGCFILDAHDAKDAHPVERAPVVKLTPEMRECVAAREAWLREYADLTYAEIVCIPRDLSDGSWAGLAYPEEIRVAAGYGDRDYVRQVIAHESGHEWEFAHFDDAARFRFMALRGLTGEWRASGAQEDYADVFAYSLGEWEQTDGRAWRTAGGTAPTQALLDTLRAEGLIP